MVFIKINGLLLTSLLCCLTFASVNAQIYTGKNVKVSIFSSTPVEDIKATSHVGAAVLALSKQELAIQVSIKSLEFDKKLMQEHFNENYMESDKYPSARFKGTIEPKIDFTKDGEYPVVAKGTLNVHGVNQARTINGKVTVKNGVISLYSTFNVACAAHKIKIPSLIITKIAEVIQVTIQGSLNPLK
jgi:hypothetical protein